MVFPPIQSLTIRLFTLELISISIILAPFPTQLQASGWLVSGRSIHLPILFIGRGGLSGLLGIHSIFRWWLYIIHRLICGSMLQLCGVFVLLPTMQLTILFTSLLHFGGKGLLLLSFLGLFLLLFSQEF